MSLIHILCVCSIAPILKLVCVTQCVWSVMSVLNHRLAGQVVKAYASGADDLGFESRLRRDFPWSSHTGDLKIGTIVATLPGALHYRVSGGTGQARCQYTVTG